MTIHFTLRLLKIHLIVSTLLLSSVAQAQYFQLDMMKKRQANKESTRWTLADWLAQKKKIDLLDLFLSMNRSKTVFEMDLGGGTRSYDVSTEVGNVSAKETYKSTHYSLSLFVYMFGLQGEYENSDEGFEEQSANVAFRILGTSQQNTHLNLKYGLRKRLMDDSEEEWEQQFAGIALSIYLTHFLGLEGEYRHHFKAQSKTQRELSGNETRVGAFLEYGALRLFANYYQEKETLALLNDETKTDREGYEYGLRLYF